MSLRGDIYIHEECYSNHSKMAGQYCIFHDFQKLESYQTGWEAIEEFLLMCQSFNIYLCFLWALFMESLSSSHSICSQSPSQSRFQGFFPNGIPTHFPGFLAAFQWLTPGWQMVQMAHYIFPGLMEKTVSNLTVLAWCLMAEKAAQ